MTAADPTSAGAANRLWRGGVWWLPLVLALSFFWQLGALPLYDLDEGAFTEATREMLASGNFITPHRDGEPRYDKPVLIYWLQAASVSLLGLHEFALRLPSALAATLWIWALWRFAREYLDAPTATAAALAMALSLQVSLIAKAAVADALLNLLLALAFFALYRHAMAIGVTQPARARGDSAAAPRDPGRHLAWAALWMGLGFLAKGPVAVFFPALVSLLFFASHGRWRDWLRAVSNPRAWAIFAAVVAPWYLAVWIDDGGGFFRSFFLEHNVGRFGAPMHGHAGFPGYYLVILPLILLPFTGWFLQLLPLVARAWRDPLDRFLWLWFGVVLLVFSFSGTKLPHYLLYGATPLFIWMARYRGGFTSRWLAWTPPVLLLLLLLLLPLLLPWAQEQATRAHEQAMLREAVQVLDAGYVLAVAAALAVLAALARWWRAPLWQGLILAGVVQTLVVFGVVAPRVLTVMQTPVKEAAQLARQLDRPTLVYRTSMPSFSVYREAIPPRRAPRPGDLVFLRIDKMSQLNQDLGPLTYTLVYLRGPVALIAIGGTEAFRGGPGQD